jgi:L-lactate dehydrogenase complex protein LldF
MAHSVPVGFHARVSLALQDRQLRTALDRATSHLARERSAALAELPDADALRERARAIRAATLRELPLHLSRFEAAVCEAGGQVHWARDAAEACAVVCGIAGRHGARRVVKSKSMLSEEIGLNHALEAKGAVVIESDLGEYIVQLAHETPSHIIAPAFHKTREQIGQLFHEKLGMPLTHDPARMTAAARARLREVYLTADMGVTGVNFGVAESGTLALVTNEGNASLSMSAPPLHVALMGIERVVPTLAELSVLLRLLARSATGQKLSVYTDLITGPRRGQPDGPEELHVVLVDNGRARALASELAEILLCIRCGACLNSCPVYGEIGGHAYGSVYSGPVGAVLTPALFGLPAWRELPYASSLCGACRDVCPLRIDIPRLLLALRATRPRLFRLAEGVGRALSRLAPRGFFRHLPPPLSRWTAERDFPAFAPRPFSALHAERRRARR